MKTFKEWWKTLLCSNNEGYKTVAELAWRQVLKEVLILNSVRRHDDVYEDIKKALEEI